MESLEHILTIFFDLGVLSLPLLVFQCGGKKKPAPKQTCLAPAPQNRAVALNKVTENPSKSNEDPAKAISPVSRNPAPQTAEGAMKSNREKKEEKSQKQKEGAGPVVKEELTQNSLMHSIKSKKEKGEKKSGNTDKKNEKQSTEKKEEKKEKDKKEEKKEEEKKEEKEEPKDDASTDPKIVPLDKVKKMGLLDDFIEKNREQWLKEVEEMKMEKTTSAERKERDKKEYKVTINEKKCELWETKQVETLDENDKEDE